MSKSHSLVLSKIYKAELVAVGIFTAIMLGVVASRVFILTKPTLPPPTIDIQQLELQKAINIVQSPMPN